MNKEKYQVLLARFGKAFLTGALSTGAVITIANAGTWSDLFLSLNAVALSMLIGGINGVLMAGEKLLTWQK